MRSKSGFLFLFFVTLVFVFFVLIAPIPYGISLQVHRKHYNVQRQKILTAPLNPGAGIRRQAVEVQIFPTGAEWILGVVSPQKGAGGSRAAAEKYRNNGIQRCIVIIDSDAVAVCYSIRCNW
jgi:hypothetical protein